MYIAHIKIDGFGKLTGEWDLSTPGLTLVVDRNEAGKSTLANAILFGLYGIPDAKSNKEIAQRVRLYQPWSETPFRIALDVTIQGRRLRVRRDFQKKPRHPAILDLETLRDVTQEFYPGSHDETGKRLTGLTLSDALKTIFLSQTELRLDREPRTTLTEAIQRIADTNTSESTTERALQAIQSALRFYPFPLLSGSAKIEYELSELEREIERTSKEYQLLQSEYEAVAQTVSRFEEIEIRLPELERIAATAQQQRDIEEWDQTSARLKADNEVSEQLDTTRKQLEELKPYEVVATIYEESLQKTYGVYENARKQFSEQTEPRLWALRKQAETTRARLTEIGATVPISTDTISEFQRIRKNWSDAATKWKQAETALREAESSLAKMGIEPTTYRSMESKWQQLLPQDETLILTMPQHISYYTDAKRTTHSDNKALDEELLQANVLRDKHHKSGNRLQLVSVIGGTIGLLSLFLLSDIARISVVSIAFAIALTTAFYSKREKQSAQRSYEENSSRIEQKRKELTEKLVPLEELYQELSKRIGEIGKILEIYGNKDILEALQKRHAGKTAYHRWESCLREVERYLEGMNENIRELVRIAAELQTPIDPNSVSEVLLESRVEKWKEIARRQNEEREAARVVVEAEQLCATKSAEIDDLTHQLNNMAASAGAPNALPLTERLEWLKHAFAKKRELERLRQETIPSLENRLLPVAERTRFESLAKSLQSKLNLNALSPLPPEYSGKDAHTIVSEAYRERDELMQERTDLSHRVQTIQSKWESAGKLQQRIGELTAARDRTTAFRDAAAIAITELTSISTKLHATWAIALNQSASLLGEAFGGSISRIDFAPDLSFSVILKNGRRLEENELSALSTGTREQLYLAVRFAIADYLGGNEPLPILLDEPFAHCDDIRFVSGMELLQKAARERQIILFTCHEQRHAVWQRTQPEPVRIVTLTD
ncbi:MAG: AAA family ATPase [bacterium]|nr:AAA family ATPase [bacterium]